MLRHSLVFSITLFLSLFVLVTSRALVSPRPLPRSHLYKRLPQGAVAPIIPAAATSDASNSTPDTSSQNGATSTAVSPASSSSGANSTPAVSTQQSAEASAAGASSTSSSTSSNSETLVTDPNLSSSSSAQATPTSAPSSAVVTPAVPLVSSSGAPSYPPGVYPTITSQPLDTTFNNGPAPTGTSGAVFHGVSAPLILVLGAVFGLILL